METSQSVGTYIVHHDWPLPRDVSCLNITWTWAFLRWSCQGTPNSCVNTSLDMADQITCLYDIDRQRHEREKCQHSIGIVTQLLSPLVLCAWCNMRSKLRDFACGNAAKSLLLKRAFDLPHWSSLAVTVEIDALVLFADPTNDVKRVHVAIGSLHCGTCCRASRAQWHHGDLIMGIPCSLRDTTFSRLTVLTSMIYCQILVWTAISQSGPLDELQMLAYMFVKRWDTTKDLQRYMHIYKLRPIIWEATIYL